MANSVIYSVVMASIFSTLPAIHTNLAIFDTQVVDLSSKLDDPVDILMSVQLGGGTDITQAVRYGSSLITSPQKAILVIISDFYEGSFTLFRPKATLIAVGLGTISWLGEGIGFYVILIGLGMTPGVHLMALAVFVLSFSTVVGAASTLPGGLGAAEASIAGLLALTGGIQPAMASSATLLIPWSFIFSAVTSAMCSKGILVAFWTASANLCMVLAQITRTSAPHLSNF
jgi:uncharacterized membrane protein YbhN (UPF0104 family)